MHLNLCPETRDGSPSASFAMNAGQSFLEWACCEAHRHKWIKSESAGCDQGRGAWRDWKLVKWPEFLGHRRHEHLIGLRQWSEFPPELFRAARGLPPSKLLDYVLSQVKWGAENLEFFEPGNQQRLPRLLRGFLDWERIDFEHPEELLLEILGVLRVNDMRPEFPDEPQIPASGCYCRAG